MKISIIPLPTLLCSAILTIYFLTSCGNAPGDGNNGHSHSNELINETSPYLLQHAHNPVNWHGWNEKTLAKAKKEGKMLVVSIGYASCHWCHVMEKESFEDTAVANLMNRHFLNIKVDREERPDVDDIYLTACELVNDACGWPLNALTLPDGKPVFIGTYMPKEKWAEMLAYFQNEWENNPGKIEEYAAKLTEGLDSYGQLSAPEGEAVFTQNTLDAWADSILQTIDFEEGGIKGMEKFPRPSHYNFLLQHHFFSKNEKSLEAVATTLHKMANGGIYDQIGGGFARYSVDDKWFVPHFEKMLYDNGQLVSLYANAYRQSKDPFYKKVVEETLAFVERELTSPEGAFYSSLDADTEGGEGEFYVWTKVEIGQLLGADAAAFCEYFNVTEKGNWEHGKNILYKTATEEPAAITKSKEVLLNARNQRPRPNRDEKVLAAWNGLMLSGYVDAYKALGEKAYLEKALKNAAFLKEKMIQPDGRLNRNFKDGKTSINAFLDDYAFVAQAFIQLYQVTFDEKWLDDAKSLTEYALAHFNNPSSPLLFYTSDLDAALVTRRTETTDDVMPSSNGVMAKNLYELGLYFYQKEWVARAQAMANTIAAQIAANGSPEFYTHWCLLYQQLASPPYEVAVVGPDAQQKALEIAAAFQPNALLLGGKDEGSLELLEGKLQEGETMIYVCRNKVCKMPTAEITKALGLMGK